MKLNRILTLCAMAATLAIGTTSLQAQNNGGPGGGRRGFDPAQFQQRMMDNIRDQLDFTNDTDWSAVQPLVQKVMDARRAAGGPGMGRMMMRPRGNNGQPNNRFRGGMFGQPSPEAEALQKAVDENAPAAQISDLLSKYRASQQAKEAALATAQANLKAVLTPRQEAQACLLGLVN